MFAGMSPLGVPTVSQPGDSDEPALLVDSLSKVYDGSDSTIRAVDDVSFTVESSSVVGVLGPNGAGKTTMIKSMLGLVIPTEGEIRVNGIDVYDDPGAAYAHVGAMLEGARNIGWRLVQHWLKSGAGRATSQLALKSGMVNANGRFRPTALR